MKNIKFKAMAASLLMVLAVSSCQKGTLDANPNAIGANSVIPVSLILNHLTANLIRSEEFPFGDVYKNDQMQISNYAKYWGTNEDTWSYSGHSYEILKYAIQLETQANAQIGANSKYAAVAKFFRAYAAIWLSQRVGDIPMTQAGDPKYLTPVFDKQHDVYKNSLKLLEDANTLLNATVASTPGVAFDSGDIFGLTNLQWQKLINTYRLRILISLSKRADDNADLNVKTQFATILGNATANPIMTSNNDNMVYKFLAANLYPPFANGNNSYNNFMNVGKPILDITTSTKDPRTFLMATPVGSNITAFSSYIGSDPGTALATLQNTAGNYSNFNGARYFGNALGTNVEPFIFIGYPEMCFNIAEAANRGWVSLNAKDWYEKGITASHSFYGIGNGPLDVYFFKAGGKVTDGASYNKFTVNFDQTAYLAQPLVSYAGNNSQGLQQIVVQKYLGFFQNSGWEGYYNYRRTGFPSFSKGGPGTANSGLIPKRFQYPASEVTNNKANWQSALNNQFGGKDDINADMWILK